MSAPIVKPDLALIADLVVARLRAFPDLAALTVTEPDDTVLSAIVGVSDGDLISQIQAATARLNVAVTVLVEKAVPVENQDSSLMYDPVEFLVEIAEFVEGNQTTPASNPPGTGTGLHAWHIADRVMAALKHWPLPMVNPYRVFSRKPGIVDATTREDADGGYKVVRCLFQTKAEGVPRALGT